MCITALADDDDDDGPRVITNGDMGRSLDGGHMLRRHDSHGISRPRQKQFPFLNQMYAFLYQYFTYLDPLDQQLAPRSVVFGSNAKSQLVRYMYL